MTQVYRPYFPDETVRQRMLEMAHRAEDIGLDPANMYERDYYRDQANLFQQQLIMDYLEATGRDDLIFAAEQGDWAVVYENIDWEDTPWLWYH